MEKNQIIFSVIITVLSSGFLNGVVTHFLYSNKLKKELKYKGIDILAKETAESLKFVRDMELEIKTQEIYDVEEEINQRGSNVDLFGGECIYPAIFNDWVSYNRFRDIIHECRSKHEKNLSCRAALNIVFIDRYVNQLSLYMSENGGEEMLHFWGTIFIFDLQKWQTKFDKILIKDINRYIYKLESHETRKWKRLRKKELIKQYEETILYFLLTGKCKKKNEKKMVFLKKFLDENIFINQGSDTSDENIQAEKLVFEE